VELFAGGAGLAIALLLNNKVKNIVINDLDYCIYSFWHSVINYTDELCQLVQDTDISVNQWEFQKNIYLNHTCHTSLEVGFATLFLNRTNRSGILNGGIIGGKNQTGTYTIDCRFNKQDIIKRIKRIADKRDCIALYNLDAGVFLQTQRELLRKWCFFYLDPPYVVKGGNLYKNAFNEEDHRQLSEVVGNILHHRKWIITYDNDPLIETLYNRYAMEAYQLSYAAHNKRKGSECMIFSDSVNIPQREIIQAARR
jgi:DNA adenine methylase